MKLCYVPIVRPMFRGAHMGLQERTQAALEQLAAQHNFELQICMPVAEATEAEAICDQLGSSLPDLLLLQHVTFATGDLIVPFLDLNLPTIVWALPEAFEEGRLPQNALCGLNMSVSLPAERTLPVRWLYGAPDEATSLEQILTSLRGAAAARQIQSARILQIGGSAPGFYRIESEPAELTIDHQPLNQLIEAVDDAPPASPPQEPSDYDLSQLQEALKIETALETAAQGYDAVSLRCWPEIPEQRGAMACLACARLADKGLPVACEGDTYGVLSMLAAQRVSGHSSVLLDLTHTSPDALMFWHCGNAAREWADDARIEKHFNRQIPAVRGMTLKPGPVTGLRLLENNRALVFSAEVITRSSRYEGVSGWVTNFRMGSEALSSHDFLGNILEYRIPHHLVFALGDHEAALRETCLWLGYDLLETRKPTGVIQWE